MYGGKGGGKGGGGGGKGEYYRNKYGGGGKGGGKGGGGGGKGEYVEETETVNVPHSVMGLAFSPRELCGLCGHVSCCGGCCRPLCHGVDYCC